jgi:polyprenyl P-hydroxybenzoate/phenylacrylic acid decarboxylase-like protein
VTGPATNGRPERLVVGISGSSAPQLGATVLRALQAIPSVETHLVLSAGARRSIPAEMGVEPEALEQMADVVHRAEDLGAAVSSGSFRTLGMVIVPCSMRTLAAVATGNTTDLLTRAADVCLKERRRLVLVTRETPLNLVHLRNMETVTLAGGVVLPPVPAFYHQPRTIQDLLDHTAGKVLDLFDLPHVLYRRWTGTPESAEVREGVADASR